MPARSICITSTSTIASSSSKFMETNLLYFLTNAHLSNKPTSKNISNLVDRYDKLTTHHLFSGNFLYNWNFFSVNVFHKFIDLFCVIMSIVCFVSIICYVKYVYGLHYCSFYATDTLTMPSSESCTQKFFPYEHVLVTKESVLCRFFSTTDDRTFFLTVPAS